MVLGSGRWGVLAGHACPGVWGVVRVGLGGLDGADWEAEVDRGAFYSRHGWLSGADVGGSGPSWGCRHCYCLYSRGHFLRRSIAFPRLGRGFPPLVSLRAVDLFVRVKGDIVYAFFDVVDGDAAWHDFGNCIRSFVVSRDTDVDILQARKAGFIGLALLVAVLSDTQMVSPKSWQALAGYGALVLYALASSALRHTHGVMSPSQGDKFTIAATTFGACVFALPFYVFRTFLVRSLS